MITSDDVALDIGIRGCHSNDTGFSVQINNVPCLTMVVEDCHFVNGWPAEEQQRRIM